MSDLLSEPERFLYIFPICGGIDSFGGVCYYFSWAGYVNHWIRKEWMMEYREFGRTGWQVSSVSFGGWAIGGTWGTVNDLESMRTLHTALDQGLNLFDTADVYGDGHSERLLAQLKKERTDEFHIITKAGRRLDPHNAVGYNRKNLTAFIERSLKNLDTESLDLVQLHCPPTEVFYMPEVFGILDDLVQNGKIRFYGVSVEKVEEAIKALEFPNVQSVQIIFNIFRQRPTDLFFELAKQRETAILARVPLSSGMLTGKMSLSSQFEEDDHRKFNRKGEEFDRGETFSGVDFATGLEAVEEIRKLVPKGWTMAQFALRWILMFDAVSCVIPGAKHEGQVLDNAAAASLPPISDEVMAAITDLYTRKIKPVVHHYW
jgi:aryl-alcohol dehydrogenase-like predicted oxidoreductase